MWRRHGVDSKAGQTRNAWRPCGFVLTPLATPCRSTLGARPFSVPSLSGLKMALALVCFFRTERSVLQSFKFLFFEQGLSCRSLIINCLFSSSISRWRAEIWWAEIWWAETCRGQVNQALFGPPPNNPSLASSRSRMRENRPMFLPPIFLPRFLRVLGDLRG